YRPRVLRGEHLGRREQSALPPRVDNPQHRQQGDDRLARTDLPLQKAAHRYFAGEIAAQLLGDAALSSGQRERQARRERILDPPAPACTRGGGAPRVLATATREQKLDRRRLVESEPRPRRVGLRLI